MAEDQTIKSKETCPGYIFMRLLQKGNSLL